MTPSYHRLPGSATCVIIHENTNLSRDAAAQKMAKRSGFATLEKMIKKIDGKYVVLSEKGDRRFGSYKTLAEAKARLRQVEFFKHRAKKKK